MTIQWSFFQFRTNATNMDLIDGYVDGLAKLQEDNIYNMYQYKDAQVLEVMGPDGRAKIPPGIMIQKNGQTYIQNSELFALEQIDSKGRNNIERMGKGLAPLDKYGKPINLHHEYQFNNARRVEISYGEHKGKHGTLHPQGASEINRSEWDKERINYWIERAEIFKGD